MNLTTLYDGRPTFLDNNGKPIHGRVCFYEASTTQFKPIWSDHTYTTEASNPMILDESGRTVSPVYLKNGLYRVKVEKFIGLDYANMNQYMVNTDQYPDADSYWKLVKDFIIDSEMIDKPSDPFEGNYCIDTIAELRDLDPSILDKVWVMGYDYLGDTVEPRYYYWDSSSQHNEDFGVHIKSNHSSMGSWVLKHGPILDASAFGINPYAGDEFISRLNGLMNYLYENNTVQEIYFPGGVYTLDDGFNLSFNIHVTCHKNLQFKVEDGGSAVVTFNKGIDYTGTTRLNYSPSVTLTIVQNEVKVSWYASSKSSFSESYYNRVIIDTNVQPLSITGKEVVIDVERTQSLNLSHCHIILRDLINTPYVNIDTCTITQDNAQALFMHGGNFSGDMIIYPWWFKPHTLYSNIHIDDKIKYRLEDWGADDYVGFKLSLNDGNIGSLNEQTLHTTYEFPNGSIIEDFVGNIIAYGSVEVHNWSGKLVDYGTDTVINAVDSWITFDAQDTDRSISSLALRRGSLSGTISSLGVTNSLYISDTDINISLVSRADNNISIFNSRINAVQNFGGYSTITRCDINANINTYPADDNKYYNIFTNNNFFGNTVHKLLPMPNVQYGHKAGVYCKWANNFSDHNFVDDTAWINVGVDNYADIKYSYHNNSGGCPVAELETGGDLVYNFINEQENNSVLTVPSSCTPNTVTLVWDWRGYHHQGDICREFWWCVNIRQVVNISNLFRLKGLMSSITYKVDCECTAIAINDVGNDWATNSFSVPLGNVQGLLLVSTNTDTVLLNRVASYEYTSDIVIDGDNDLDDRWSRLLKIMWDHSASRQAYYRIRIYGNRFNV